MGIFKVKISSEFLKQILTVEEFPAHKVIHGIPGDSVLIGARVHSIPGLRDKESAEGLKDLELEFKSPSIEGYRHDPIMIVIERIEKGGG